MSRKKDAGADAEAMYPRARDVPVQVMADGNYVAETVRVLEMTALQTARAIVAVDSVRDDLAKATNLLVFAARHPQAFAEFVGEAVNRSPAWVGALAGSSLQALAQSVIAANPAFFSLLPALVAYAAQGSQRATSGESSKPAATSAPTDIASPSTTPIAASAPKSSSPTASIAEAAPIA